MALPLCWSMRFGLCEHCAMRADGNHDDGSWVWLCFEGSRLGVVKRRRAAPGNASNAFSRMRNKERVK